MNVCVLGRGKVGTALARALAHAGEDVSHLRGRPPWPALPNAQVYLLAVPEASLTMVAAALAPRIPRGVSVLHCAGSRSHEELSALRTRGASVGVLHPLVSFADRRQPPPLAGATFVFQGDPPARRHAKRLARALTAQLLEEGAVGPAYHAAAALVANAGVALAWSGARILGALGFSERHANAALAGLMASVAHNVRRVGLPRALTGPVARGDTRTVRAHLDALRTLDPSFAASYASVLPLVVACAQEAGLPDRAARDLRKLATPGAGRRPSGARRGSQRKT